MIVNGYRSWVYSVICIGASISYIPTSRASASSSPTAYVVSAVAVGALACIAVGWNWCTAEKVVHISHVVDGVSQNMSHIQTVQTNHTTRLAALQTSTDTNCQNIQRDISALHVSTEKGIADLKTGHEEIKGKVDALRASTDKQFNEQRALLETQRDLLQQQNVQLAEQARELVQIKAMVAQLHKNYVPCAGASVVGVKESGAAAASSTPLAGAAPYRYTSVVSRQVVVSTAS